MLTNKSSLVPIPLLYRGQSTPVAIAEDVANPKFRVDGYERIVGNFHVSTAAAAGYPRIRQSADGIIWSRVDIINIDPTQADFQYPFDLAIVLPYVAVEYRQGAAQSTFIYCWVEARP